MRSNDWVPAAGGGRRAASARAASGAVALAATALLTAACGGSSTGTAGSAPGANGGRFAQALAFAQCMRSHGVPSFPDPDSSGGFVMTPANHTDFQGQTSARQACKQYIPRKPSLTPAQQRANDAANLRFADCMRRHGFPQFPDGWSGNIGQLISAGINPNAPQFNAALNTCGF